mgnify:CR=1 FL=1
MAKIEFHNQGQRRRFKAASTLVVIYGTTISLHLSPWGSHVILGLLVLMTVHSVRLVFARSPIQAPTDSNWQPPVSILVAAKNEEAVISQLVECLCQLKYPNYDLWVVDDHSSDRTPEILKQLSQKYTQLHVLRREADAKGGKSGALNQVLPLTQGEIIGVFDADAQLEPDSLAQIIPLFQDPQIGAIQMRKSIANAPQNFWTQGQQAEMALDIWLQQHRISIGGIGELRGNGQFVRRTALQDCGGWNEQTITDDLDLTLKLHLANWQIACLLHPPVQEEGVTTWKQLWHQRNRWAEGGYQRYLDYYRLLLNSQMGISKNFDLFLFLFNQYLLPIALVPDLILAIAWQKSPIFSPVATLAFSLSFWGMIRGIQQSYQVPFNLALLQTLRGALYMLHWLPVMVSVTLRMAIRPKKLKWVKTLHQGLTQPKSI